MGTLGYALLGLLAREPLSGYDLAQRMKVPVGFFWHAQHSQIYPALAELEARGLVTHQVVHQQDRPDKKVYSITPRGREALRRWVVEPVAVPTVRDALVLKAFCLWVAEPAAAIELFRSHERYHAQQLACYEQLREQLERECADELRRPDSPLFANYVVLQRGIGFEREYAAWCGWVAEQLERAAAERSAPPNFQA